MAQVLLDSSEKEQIEQLVTEFDPATHPSFAPQLENLSGEDLEIVRAYVADETPGREVPRSF
jgi:hypothetical protein